MSHSFLIDVSPLRVSAPFRHLFAARACTFFALGILTFAVNLQIYELTQSTLAVAMLAVALAAPLTLSMLAGGLLADRYDKRQLMLWSRLVYLAAMVVLLVNAWQSQPAAWPIFLAAAIAGAATGISMPAFMAAVPALIGRDKLPAAAALGALVSQSSSILGPALAGLLMAHGGIAVCYLIVTLGALLAPVFLALLPPLPAPQVAPSETAAQGAQGIIASLRDGFSYIRASQIIAGLLLIDVAATLFATPFAVLPQFGTQGLGADARALGLMFSAPAVGALGAALASGWISRLARAGRALIVAVCAWGLAVAALGLAPNLTIVLICLVAMGFADTVSEILRGAMLQQHTPDALLGRLSSLWLIQASVTPALGGIAIGALAQAHSPRFAFLIGGATCLVAAFAIALLLPTFRRAAAVTKAKS